MEFDIEGGIGDSGAEKPGAEDIGGMWGCADEIIQFEGSFGRKRSSLFSDRIHPRLGEVLGGWLHRQKPANVTSLSRHPGLKCIGIEHLVIGMGKQFRPTASLEECFGDHPSRRLILRVQQEHQFIQVRGVPGEYQESGDGRIRGCPNRFASGRGDLHP